jgi:hypothetical protein
MADASLHEAAGLLAGLAGLAAGGLDGLGAAGAAQPPACDPHLDAPEASSDDCSWGSKPVTAGRAGSKSKRRPAAVDDKRSNFRWAAVTTGGQHPHPRWGRHPQPSARCQRAGGPHPGPRPCTTRAQRLGWRALGAAACPPAAAHPVGSLLRSHFPSPRPRRAAGACSGTAKTAAGAPRCGRACPRQPEQLWCRAAGKKGPLPWCRPGELRTPSLPAHSPAAPIPAPTGRVPEPQDLHGLLRTRCRRCPGLRPQAGGAARCSG